MVVPALHDEQARVFLAGLQALLSHVLLLPIGLIVVIILVSINVSAGQKTPDTQHTKNQYVYFRNTGNSAHNQARAHKEPTHIKV
jgi:hypothetical protein